MHAATCHYNMLVLHHFVVVSSSRFPPSEGSEGMTMDERNVLEELLNGIEAL